MEVFSGVLREHFAAPRNVGRIDGAAGIGVARNAVCGDELHLYLDGRGERITEARFQARGCSALIATASLLTEALRGLPYEAARELDLGGLLLAAGGLPPRRAHAEGVATRALELALDSARNPLPGLDGPPSSGENR